MIHSDISNAVREIASHQDNPTPDDWAGATRILQYLAGTRDHGLTYGPHKGPSAIQSQPLVGFADATWAGCLETRRSVTGYVFQLHGGTITWSSCKQKSVALSSAEAEYMAVSDASKEAVWISGLLGELGLGVQGPVIIYDDNQATIEIASNPKDHARTKHIDIRFHHIRERIALGQVILEYVRTNEQRADILTKALHKPAFIHLKSLLRVMPVRGVLSINDWTGMYGNSNAAEVDINSRAAEAAQAAAATENKSRFA